MAAKHSCGNIGEFDPTVENWNAYLEQMERYFVANEVTSAAKKVVLLSICGASLCSTIHSLASPTKPTDLENSGLLELTRKHYNPSNELIST